jgi:transposase
MRSQPFKLLNVLRDGFASPTGGLGGDSITNISVMARPLSLPPLRWPLAWWKVGHYTRRRRREFLDFMNQVVAQYPNKELHVILDNLNTHKPKHDRWLVRHPTVHFHYTPTHASWLNQIEVWFSILCRQALKGLSVTSFRKLRQAIDDFTVAYSQTAHPFEWTKTIVHPGQLKNKYADLCN